MTANLDNCAEVVSKNGKYICAFADGDIDMRTADASPYDPTAQEQKVIEIVLNTILSCVGVQVKWTPGTGWHPINIPNGMSGDTIYELVTVAALRGALGVYGWTTEYED